MFVEKLAHSLFADQVLPENLTELSIYPIEKIVLFYDEEISLFQRKGINNLSDLAYYLS